MFGGSIYLSYCMSIFGSLSHTKIHIKVFFEVTDAALRACVTMPLDVYVYDRAAYATKHMHYAFAQLARRKHRSNHKLKMRSAQTNKQTNRQLHVQHTQKQEKQLLIHSLEIRNMYKCTLE